MQLIRQFTTVIRRHIKAIALVSPLMLFFGLGALIPQHTAGGEGIDANWYLVLVILRVVLIGAVIVGCWRIYLADFPLQVDRWGWIVGAIGGLLWIGICGLGIEPMVLKTFGFSADALGVRSGVDPFHLYDIDAERWLFLTFRFALLVLIVPIAEELFLRGFFMRVVDCDDWASQPLTQIGTAGMVAGTAYGVLTHPSEMVAAAVWFSLITLLMIRSGRFWNCVLAHAITNLILGVYVCYTHSWQLW